MKNRTNRLKALAEIRDNYDLDTRTGIEEAIGHEKKSLLHHVGDRGTQSAIRKDIMYLEQLLESKPQESELFMQGKANRLFKKQSRRNRLAEFGADDSSLDGITPHQEEGLDDLDGVTNFSDGLKGSKVANKELNSITLNNEPWKNSIRTNRAARLASFEAMGLRGLDTVPETFYNMLGRVKQIKSLLRKYPDLHSMKPKYLERARDLASSIEMYAKELRNALHTNNANVIDVKSQPADQFESIEDNNSLGATSKNSPAETIQ